MNSWRTKTRSNLGIRTNSSLMENKLKVNIPSSNIRTTMTLSFNPIISPMISFNFLKKKPLISTISNKHVMLNSTNTTIIKIIHILSKNRPNLLHLIETNPTLPRITDSHFHLFHINKPIPLTKIQMLKMLICT